MPSEDYASRFVILPIEAMAIRDVWMYNVRYNESHNNDINRLCKGEFLIKSNKIWFGSIPGKMTINYDKITVDEDGLPMVSESHVNALAWYIIFHLDYAEYRKGNLSRTIMQDSEEIKNRAFRQARGSDNMEDWKTTKIINQNLANLYSPYRFRNYMHGQQNSDFQTNS